MIIKNLLENIIQIIRMNINMMIEKIHILESRSIMEKEINMEKKEHIKINFETYINI